MTSKRLTPCQAIKRYCKVDCCASDLRSWKDCTRRVCPLFPYRIGKRPSKLPFEAYSTKKQGDLTIKSAKNSIVEPVSEAQATLNQQEGEKPEND